MNHIEQAIKEAVEKGSYKGAESVEWPVMDFGSVSLILKTGGKLHYWWSEIFLDPSFWQALGKARGWHEGDKTQLFAKKRLYLYEPIEEKYSWLGQWHRFIDHLAEGKDAESFFATLV